MYGFRPSAGCFLVERSEFHGLHFELILLLMIKLRMLETAETEQFRYGSSFSDALTASLKPIILFL